MADQSGHQDWDGPQPQPPQFPPPGPSNQPPQFPPPGQPGAGQFQPPTPSNAPPAYPQPGPGGGTQFPPPGGSPYGQPPLGAPLQPPKKRRTWLWILLGVFLLIILAIGGCTALVISQVRGPLDAANEWVALVDEGDYDAAYDSMCSAIRSTNDSATIQAALETQFGAGITDYTLNSIAYENGDTVVDGTISVAGVSRPIFLEMVEEGDEWRVCSFT